MNAELLFFFVTRLLFLEVVLIAISKKGKYPGGKVFPGFSPVFQGFPQFVTF